MTTPECLDCLRGMTDLMERSYGFLSTREIESINHAIAVLERIQEQHKSSERPQKFTCPHCGASHSRGPLNGSDVYRCLRCGETTKIQVGNVGEAP